MLIDPRPDNEPFTRINLGEFEIDFRTRNSSTPGTTTISCELAPSQRIVFDMSLPGNTSIFNTIINAQDLYVYVHKLFTTYKILVLDSNLPLFSKKVFSVRATPASEPQPYGFLNTTVGEFSFDIWNFPNFTFGSKSKKDDNHSFRQGFASTKLSAYELTIYSYDNQKQKRENAKKYGGFIKTHYATLRPVEQDSMGLNDLEKIDKFLRNSLSLLRGAYVAPHIYRGFSGNVERCGRIGSLENTPWQTRHVSSLFDENDVSFEFLINRLWYLWNYHTRTYVLENAISWYLRSNLLAAGIEASIVLSVATLELLSWSYLVEENSFLKQKGFNDLNSSERIRILTRSLNIPIEIPTFCTNLQGCAQAFKLDDLCEVLPFFRNKIIHPELDRRQQIQNGFFDAWNCAQWLIEMIILAASGYNGKYSDRRKLPVYKGNTQRVPFH